MSRNNRTRIWVSPWAAGLLAVFIAFSSPVVLASLLLAALCHELGHYLALRCFGACVEAVSITVFGAEIRVADRPALSYGRELLTVAAGPAVNLLLATVLAGCGSRWDELYLFAGAQMVLGVFNLLPVRPLDGGTMLWLVLAWCTDPFVADRSMRWVGVATTGIMMLFSLWFWVETGSPFLLLGAAGLSKPLWQEKKLVKVRKRR